MKSPALIMIAAAVAVILFWFAGPAYLKDRIRGVVTFATDERRCFSFHKDDFKDPETAYVESSYVWTKANETKSSQYYTDPVFTKYDAVIKVKVRAKNAMGGYVSEHVECPLVNSSFDEYAASMHRLDRRARNR